MLLKPKGIKLAAPRALRRLKCAIVPIARVTVVVSLVFSAVKSGGKKKSQIDNLN